MYREYIKKIMENVDEYSKEDVYKMVDKYGCLMEKTMDHLKDCDEKLYDEIECSLYVMANGKVISKEMAKKWVASMKPYEEHWDLESVKEVIKSNSLDVDPVEFYVVLNMMFNDYYKVIGDDLEMYIKLSKAWLKDEDARKDKLFEYWQYISEH